MPSLILIKSPGGTATGQSYPLEGGDAFLIGRDAEKCQIVIPNSAVSREHARITRSNGRFLIEDLRSRNHTFVNQTKVSSPTLLKSEDRIKICDFLFRFYDEKAPANPDDLEFNRGGGETEDEPDGLTTVQQLSGGRGAAQQLLEVQTADVLRELLDISTSLSKTLDLDLLLTQLPDTMFRVFRHADRCFVILRDDAGRLIPKVVKSRRAGTGEDQRFSRTIVRSCLETLQAYLSKDASAEAGLSSHSIAEIRIRSVMCVPLATADGRRLGAIQLDTQQVGKEFTADNLQLLTILANLASVALEKAEVHAQLVVQEKERKEVEVARRVQVGFLPKSFPELPGYEFFAFYSPAMSVGGDYYDFILLPQGKVGIVLGDVAGKGVAAALLMAKLSAEVRYSMLTESDPARAVALLNDQLIRGGIGDRFVTLAVLIIDPATHTLTVVNAGHINPMRLRSANGEFVEIISNGESGLPLGLVAGFPYEARVIPLEIGDTLVVFTDGVTDAESPSGTRFQHEGLKNAILSESLQDADGRPQKLGDRVIRAVQRHAAGHPQSDDIALVCFGRVAGGPSTTSHLVPRLVEPGLNPVDEP